MRMDESGLLEGLVEVKRGIAKVAYTHDAMIDLIVQDPTISQGKLALAFGYTQGWVSQIIASDAFQARLAERKDTLVDPTIRATIEDRFKALVVRSLEILQEKLNKPSSAIPDNLALRSVELATRALGYGARKDTPPAQPAEGAIEALAERLVTLQSDIRQRQAINVEAETVEFKEVRNEAGADKAA